MNESKQKPLIVFVDDERFYALEYIDELKTLNRVEYFQCFLDAIEYVNGLDETFILILDVMMPPKTDEIAIKTQRGQSTGIWVLEQVFKTVNSLNCLVILLTNKDIQPSALSPNGLRVDSIPTNRSCREPISSNERPTNKAEINSHPKLRYRLYGDL